MPAAPFVLWCLLIPARIPADFNPDALLRYHVIGCAQTDKECEDQREADRGMCENGEAHCASNFERCMRSDDPRLRIDRGQRLEIAHAVTTAFLRRVVHMNAARRHAELQKYGITEQEYEDAIGMSEGDAEQSLGRALEVPSAKP